MTRVSAPTLNHSCNSPLGPLGSDIRHGTSISIKSNTFPLSNSRSPAFSHLLPSTSDVTTLGKLVIMACPTAVHAILKSDNAQHASYPLSVSPKPLADNSVRVRVRMVSLTSNNLSYARGGTMFRWWDTYPVPADSPAPYNDRDEYGVVPAWGYGEILESTAAIPAGKLLFGFWPTYSLPVDLELEPHEPKGHWREVSKERSHLWTIYNRYHEVNEPIPSSSFEVNSDLTKKMAYTALVQPVWGCGYLMGRYLFPEDPKACPPIHPLGQPGGWSESDGDISSAVLVSLSASSKTGQSFSWQILYNRSTSGPLGLVQATSVPASAIDPSKSVLPTKTVTYAELIDSATTKWIASLKPNRIVIADFGASAQVLDDFVQGLKSSDSPVASAAITIIGIGSEQKVYTPDELRERMVASANIGKMQYNTSGVRDRVLEREDAESHWSTYWEAWDRFLADTAVADVEIVLGNGVQGEKGLEGGWDALCAGRVVGNKGLVYLL